MLEEQEEAIDRSPTAWSTRGVVATIIVCGLLALCATAVCGYRFGIADQAQYLVEVVDVEDPAALRGDPYLGVFPSLRSCFWRGIAILTTEESRSVVCLSFALLLTAFNAALLMRIGQQLLGPRPRGVVGGILVAAALPLVLVVPKEQNWFGLVSLGDIELTATLAVLPCVFATILFWVLGRRWWALVPCLVAVPVHGQTALYLLATWWLATLWVHRRDRLMSLAMLCLVPLAVAAGAVLLGERFAGGDFRRYVDVSVDLYQPLVDPLEAPATAWGAVVAILLLGVAAAGACTPGVRQRSAPHQRLLEWWIASAGLPLAGLTLLAAGVQTPWLMKVMVGRSLMLPQIVALMMFAVWAVQSIAAGSRRGLLGLTTFGLLVLWPFSHLPSWLCIVTLAILIVLVAFASPGRDLAAGLPWRRATTAVSGVFLMVCVAAVIAFAQRPYPWLARGECHEWVSAQQWARSATQPGTTFLTPPYLSGWRIGSHRPTWGEVNDGGLSFYAGSRLIQWADRMTLLGMTGPYRWHDSGQAEIGGDIEPLRAAYRDAIERNLDEIDTLSDVAYLVTEAGYDVDVGEIAWSCDRFVIRRLDDRASSLYSRLSGGSDEQSRSVGPGRHYNSAR